MCYKTKNSIQCFHALLKSHFRVERGGGVNNKWKLRKTLKLCGFKKPPDNTIINTEGGGGCDPCPSAAFTSSTDCALV